MFSENKKKATPNTYTSQNIIANGTTIEGDITTKGDLRIDGTINGNLKANGKVVVGKTGYINGALDGADAYFEGRFKGDLKLTGTLTLKSTAQIEGEVALTKLAVEPGAIFNVNCTMKGAVKNINKGEQKTISEKEKSA